MKANKKIDIMVHVVIDPHYRDIAIKRGYDVEPFNAVLLPGEAPWMFWHRVRPLSGHHCKPVDLPPMFRVEKARRD